MNPSEDPRAFLGVACPDEEARVALLPVPYAGTVCYGEGTDEGPAAIIAASTQVELYDARFAREPFKTGITTLPALDVSGSPEDVSGRVEAEVGRILDDGKRPLLLGGEHSISSGAIRAAFHRLPGLSVLHLDAHLDLRQEYEGTRYSHACVMRRVHEMGVPIVSLGVRSGSAEEWALAADADGISVCPRWSMDDLAFEQAVSNLGRSVYLTVDVDVMDPSIIPSTGTPEPDGLSYAEVVEIMLGLSGREVVGMDIVELAPVAGLHAPDFTCASLAHTAVGLFWPPA